MDIVFIRDLRIETVIGVGNWERQVQQIVRVDVELGCDIRAAASGDDIDRAVDYDAVARRVGEYVRGSSFRLVEALAEHLATLILEEYRVPWLRLTVAKPGAVRGAREVGVTIERGRAPAD